MADSAFNEGERTFLRASGLRSFPEEYAESISIDIEGVPLRVLPLTRILASKRAVGRHQGLAQIPAIEEAIAALASDATGRGGP